MAETLFDAVQRQAALTDSVIVSYSGGKDSAVTLDLCKRHFAHVQVFFMYQIPGLSFQEAVLKWAEKRYSLEIYRIPHWELSHFYRSGSFARPDAAVPIVNVKDIYTHVRGVFDIHWISAGERCKDSMVRNAMIKKSGSIDVGRGRFFPIAYWSKEHITRYITRHQLKVSPESALLGHSFRSLQAKDLALVKTHYPLDYEKILKAFPEAAVTIERERMYGNKVTAA